MRLSEKVSDIYYMARDFVAVLRGTDYFRQPDLLGRYFEDGKSYFIDFRGKVRWSGARADGVPLLDVPSLGRAIPMPTMILQYGLGSIDLFLETGDRDALGNLGSVARWIARHVKERGCFDNHCRELNRDERVEFYSNNSAMSQGQAISFVVRVVRDGLVDSGVVSLDTARMLYENMTAPLDAGGTALYSNGDVYLCEYCRKDGYVVLNGWIFAIFGLYDYWVTTRDSGCSEILRASIGTLERRLGGFVVERDNWSYYDNHGRLASPVYQLTHINQTDALFRLTGVEAFRQMRDRMAKGYNRINRVKYTSRKILEKLRDPHRYTTAR